MTSPVAIPRIIHQTWKTAEIPEQWIGWQQSWQHFHPDWEYRLWTDEDNRAFLRQHYPWFLPIYDGYPKPIQRADAVRYFFAASLRRCLCRSRLRMRAPS